MSTATPVPDAAPALDADFGWALRALTTAFRERAGDAVSTVPGGPRGFLVLTALREGPPESQLALARTLGFDKTVLTYLLDGLEERALVSRTPDPADRRARRIVVTPRGRRLLTTVQRRMTAAECDLLSALEPAEAQHFRAMLARIAATVRSDGICDGS